MRLILAWTAVLCLIYEVSPASGTSGGSTAERLVAEALQAEAAGDADRRAMLLDQAVAVAPDYQLARWHRGEIQTAGQWQSVETLQQTAADDPRRAEYLQLRKLADDSLDAQLALARWCRRNNLDGEAWFHWANVVSKQPGNEEALRALGMRWYQNRLLTYDEIDQAKQHYRENREAAKRWAPQITRWERAIAGDLPEREQAIDEIRNLADADAIPALEELTLEADISDDLDRVRCRQISRAFVHALSNMRAHVATESLVRHALLSPVTSVRDVAITALHERPLHDFVPMLLDALAMPIESTFRVSTDRDGSVHYWHSFYRKGREANWAIEGRSSVMQVDLNGTTQLLGDDGRTVVGERRTSGVAITAQKTAVATVAQTRYGIAATQTEQQVDAINATTIAKNRPILLVLHQVTGQELGDDPKAWWKWWDDYNDYYSKGEPPLYERRYVETEMRYYRVPTSEPARHSCFAPGTLVWTSTGLRRIETIEIGDLMLAQDTDTGELQYKTVMGRTLRPDRATRKLRIDKETLQATLGHPLWLAGEGWRMAKLLEPGAVLHGVHGPVLVETNEAGEKMDVFNLIVADYHNYFVGEAGVLVHDNSPRQPTTATVPGLVAKKAH